MLYDKLAKAVEMLGEPSLYKLVEEARLFDFPYVPQEVLPKELVQDQVEFLKDTFFLPFPTIAIEDKATCVVISDMGENLHGINAPRVFLEMSYSHKDGSVFRDGDELAAEIQEGPPLHIMIFGTLHDITADSKGWKAAPEIGLAAVFEDNMSTCKVIHQSFYNQFKCAATNWITSLEELLYINAPDRFVLEKRPIKERKKQKKIARSHERSVYTILKPREIREKLGWSQPTGRHVSAHERRAHQRYLTSPRYKDKRFTHVFVPATWVGPSEKKNGKHIWKVMLDK